MIDARVALGLVQDLGGKAQDVEGLEVFPGRLGAIFAWPLPVATLNDTKRAESWLRMVGMTRTEPAERILS